jgi:hypothetical protein
MLKIDRNNKTFNRLNTPSLSEVSITERYDLQEYICNSPSDFFRELGQELFLVGKEIKPSENVHDRIDVLAIDKEGNAVIVELKRGNHKLHMLQAIAYAGMVSKWKPEDFAQWLSVEKQEELNDFLEIDPDEINRQQRIILVAEAYDYALLTAAEWLSEQYGVDIVCCRLSLACDQVSKAEYLVCSNVFPAPELVGIAAPRGPRRSPGKTKWADWETALSAVSNQALRNFFQQQLAMDQECYLHRRTLIYRINGSRRWFVSARRPHAYTWQRGRFGGDLEFWKGGLSEPDKVTPVKEGACLRFFLSTPKDFQYFDEAAKQKLAKAQWTTGVSDDDEAIEEAED